MSFPGQPRILMCPPEYYGIHYEINPWMNRRQPADHVLAVRQWTQLRAILAAAGAEICLLPPVPGLPDMVFTANAGLIHRRQAVLSRFRPPQRRPEQAYAAAWFAEHGFAVLQLPEGVYFEGAGDALFCGDTLFAGYRIRSDARGQQLIGQALGCRVMPLELISPYFYHLDTCFCPLGPGAALWFPDAFDDYGRHVVRESVDVLLELPACEAESFAANAVVVGQTVVTNAGCPQTHDLLRAHGFHPVATPLSEFVKAGGSAKCLTLRLDGEDAAAWKETIGITGTDPELP